MNENISLVLIYLIFLVSVISVGSILSRLLQLEFDNHIEDLFFRFVFGTIFFSYLFQLLGATHLLYSQILLAFYLIPLLYPLYCFFNISRNFFQKVNLSGENILLLLLLLFILFPIIPYLFLFPSAWDPLAYHLVLPKLYLSDHFFTFYSHFPQTGFPIGIESLYGFGELFKEPRFSSLLNFTFLTSAAIYILFGLKKIFNRKVLILAFLLYLFRTSLYSELATNSFIDYGFSFFGLATGIALYKFITSKKTNWMTVLIFLGLFCPLIKVSGFIVLLSLSITLLLFFINNRSTFLWKKYLPICIIAALPLTFWLTKNTILIHDPIYPFMNSVFDSVDYDPKSYVSMLSTIKRDYWQIGKAIQNISHRADSADDYSVLGDFLYFVMLISCSLASLFVTKGKERYLSLFAILTLAPIGILVSPVYRYYLPIVPVAALVTANWFISTLERWQWRHLPFVGIFVLSFFIQIDSTFRDRTLMFTNVPKQNLLNFFDFKNSKTNYYTSDNALMTDYINGHLDSQEDKMLVVFDNRLYYYQIPCIFENPSKLGHFTNPDINTVSEVNYALKKENINYVLINTNWGLYPNLKKELFQSFVSKKLTIVYPTSPTRGLEGLTLYKLKD